MIEYDGMNMLLKEMKEYIEGTEVSFSRECKLNYTFEELHKYKLVPELYNKVLKAIEDVE